MTLHEEVAEDRVMSELSPQLPVPAAQGAHAPDALQRELMAEFAITFRADAYHLGPYRYAMLDDAVKYARLLRMQGREVDPARQPPASG